MARAGNPGFPHRVGRGRMPCMSAGKIALALTLVPFLGLGLTKAYC